MTDEDHAQSRERIGRTIDGQVVPQAIPTTSSAAPVSSSASKQPSKKKFATLGDLGSGGGAHAGHGHGDGDSDDDGDQDFFAGGEKSGLAVQNPDELKRKILEKARRYVSSPRTLYAVLVITNMVSQKPTPANFRRSLRLIISLHRHRPNTWRRRHPQQNN